jgi:hypothetical protein
VQDERGKTPLDILKWQRWNDTAAAADAQRYLEEAMREAERVWVMRAGRKAREEGGREGGLGGVQVGGGDDEKGGAIGTRKGERQEGRKGGRAGWKGSQHPMTDAEDEDEDEKEDEEEEAKKRTAAVLTFVMDSDERRKGLCLDLFEELMELAQVRWAGRV